ncbi:Thylakoid membrane protein TERC, chloroplastic [Linum perenne]
MVFNLHIKASTPRAVLGLASAIHDDIRASPVNFRPFSFRVSTDPKSVRVQLVQPQFPSISAAARGGRRRRICQVAAARGTEKEGDLSNSEAEKISSERHDDDAVESLDKIEGDKTYVTSVKTVALCVGSAVAFGIGIGLKEGVGKASEFFAGYLLEQSLSVDNLFVFVLIFNYFKVPLMYQNRVLSYGIAGAIIFRLSLILLGTVTLQRFEAVNLLLAGILLYSSFKLLFVSEEDDADLSENFIVKTCQRFIPVTCNFLGEAVFSGFYFLMVHFNLRLCFTAKYDGDRFITNQEGMWKVSHSRYLVSHEQLVNPYAITAADHAKHSDLGTFVLAPFLTGIDHFGQATPLLLTVAVLELSDIAFAVDSIPAVFGVTRDPFIVISSNLFAILGLRSFFTLISQSMSELEYLQPSIAIVLGFIGCKMILDFFGFHVSTEASLGFVATSLSIGVIFSLLKNSESDE